MNNTQVKLEDNTWNNDHDSNLTLKLVMTCSMKHPYLARCLTDRRSGALLANWVYIADNVIEKFLFDITSFSSHYIWYIIN